jgi:ABC-type branched-subunit amino acid transport system substrate-binding protein
MKMIRFILRLPAIFIIMMFIFHGCSKDSRTEKTIRISDRAPVKIGVILPLTGPCESIARNHLAAISTAAGNAPGIAGRNVAITLRDSKGDSNTAIEAVRQFEKENAAGVILLACGDEYLELSRLYCPDTSKRKHEQLRLQIPVIVVNAPDSAPGTCSGIWRLSPSSDELIRASLHFIRSTMNATRIAVILDSGKDGGIKFATMFLKEFTNSGGTIIDIYDINEKGFREKLSKLNRKKPSLIIIPDADNKTSEIVRLLRSENIKIPVFFIRSPENKDVFETLRDNPGIYLLNNFSFQPTNDERCKRLLEVFSKDNISPETGAFISADALFLLIDASVLPHNTASDMIPLLSISGNETYLTGKISLMVDGSVKKTLYVVKLNGSDTETVEGINLICRG